jgi:hypothetical protein
MGMLGGYVVELLVSYECVGNHARNFISISRGTNYPLVCLSFPQLSNVKRML